MAKDKRKEIRISTSDMVLYDKVKQLAQKNKRSMGKQAEFMVESCIKNTGKFV